MNIPITIFIPPNGRQKQCFIASAPKEIETMARFCIDAGARFTQERLMTGMMSLTCEYKLWNSEDIEDIAIELYPDGIGIGSAFEKMVRDAYRLISKDKEEI